MAFKQPRFSRGQAAPVDREGTAEFKTKKRRKAPKATVKKGPAAPAISALTNAAGGMGVGLV